MTSAEMTAGGTGAVYDRGYRPYEGERGGRQAATFALYRATLRRALGLRRSWRQKFAPFVLLGIATIPAVVNVGVGYVTRNEIFQDRIEIITYREYVGVSSTLLLFVALVAPDVICPDRRQRVLPLMFARPLTGVDYVAAKFGAITTILFFSFIPQVVLFVGSMLVSDSSFEYFREHLDVPWKVAAAVLVLSVYYAAIGLAIASLTDRRIVAGASVIGLFLVTSISTAILVGEESGYNEGSPAALLNVLALPLEVRDLIFLGHIHPTSDLAGVDNGGLLAVAVYSGVLAIAVATLLRRYRWVER